METILTGRVEQFNLFWIDMKCVIRRGNKIYKMIKAEKNIWTNKYEKSVDDKSEVFIFSLRGLLQHVSVQRDHIQLIYTSKNY
jgi:hypothetical protein